MSVNGAFKSFQMEESNQRSEICYQQIGILGGYVSLICESLRNPWFRFLNKQTQFQDQQNYAKCFLNMH